MENLLLIHNYVTDLSISHHCCSCCCLPTLLLYMSVLLNNTKATTKGCCEQNFLHMDLFLSVILIAERVEEVL